MGICVTWSLNFLQCKFDKASVNLVTDFWSLIPGLYCTCFKGSHCHFLDLAITQNFRKLKKSILWQKHLCHDMHIPFVFQCCICAIVNKVVSFETSEDF